MKKFIMLLLFAMLDVIPAIADDSIPSQQGSNNPIAIVIKNPGGRPKAPSRQHIECWYVDGSLSFDFAIPEGECELTVIDRATGFIRQYWFDSEESAEIYVGSLANGSTLEIRTANGHSYFGEIIFE